MRLLDLILLVERLPGLSDDLQTVTSFKWTQVVDETCSDDHVAKEGKLVLS